VQKKDVISLLKDPFPENFASIKVIPVTEAGKKKMNNTLSLSKNSCRSLSCIYNYSPHTVIFPDCLKTAVVKSLYDRKHNYSDKPHAYFTKNCSL